MSSETTTLFTYFACTFTLFGQNGPKIDNRLVFLASLCSDRRTITGDRLRLDEVEEAKAEARDEQEGARFCAKSMNFVEEMMDSVLNMMDCATNMCEGRDRYFHRNNPMNEEDDGSPMVAICINIDEICIKTMDFALTVMNFVLTMMILIQTVRL